jgi:hypothetical protein
MMTRAVSKALLFIGPWRTATFLILSILLAFIGTACAQVTLGDTAKTSSALSHNKFTADDTARAIHNLFNSRRSGGIVLTGGAIVGDLVAAQLVNESDGNQNSFIRFDFGFFAAFFGVIAAPVAAVGIGKIITYRGSREKRIIADFRATHRLPDKIQKRLKPKFFAQPTGKAKSG